MTCGCPGSVDRFVPVVVDDDDPQPRQRALEDANDLAVEEGRNRSQYQRV